jgi:uncharacterized Zn finger protein
MAESDSNEPQNPDVLVACARCGELVVTVEMRTPHVVYWRCVRCGHLFVQRLTPPSDRAGKRGV